MKKPMLIVLILIFAGFLVTACGVIILGGYYGISSTLDDLDWKERTSPLEDTVRQDICIKFELQDDDPRCLPGAVVYAPEFFSMVKETFTAEPQNPVTLDQVQIKLAEYLDHCEPLTKVSNGLEYYRCWYDLQGDKVYPIIAYFYRDNTLMKIQANITD